MIKLENGLITQKYTEIYHEKDFNFHAPHHFEVYAVGDSCQYPLQKIDFQKGPIKEAGINGVSNEDLIAMVIRRLQGFQTSPYQCRENSIAITKLEEALMWLRKRTVEREIRNVEGTHII